MFSIFEYRRVFVMITYTFLSCVELDDKAHNKLSNQDQHCHSFNYLL